MTQISRPFQIALAVLVLFVAVWFLALRGHSSSGSSSEPATPAAATPAVASPSPTPSATSSTPAKSAPERHAAAPTAGSLKRTIDKAQGAARHSQHAHGTVSKAASNAATTPRSATTPKAATKPAATATSKPSTAATSTPAKPHAASGAASAANTQKAVEAELKQGKVVAVLFWNQNGTVDGVVRRELQSVSHASHGGVIVHVAQADEIGAFGSFTRAVQVYSTPTILLVNKRGKTSSLSGLTDVFGIEQAVREVKRAK
jgi:hypothetical protein